MKGSENKKTSFAERMIVNRKKGVLRTFSQINPKILENVDFKNDQIDSPLVLICLNEVKSKHSKDLHKKTVDQIRNTSSNKKHFEKAVSKLRNLAKKDFYNLKAPHLLIEAERQLNEEEEQRTENNKQKKYKK